jgi:hypothetical protein
VREVSGGEIGGGEIVDEPIDITCQVAQPIALPPISPG